MTAMPEEGIQTSARMVPGQEPAAWLGLQLLVISNRYSHAVYGEIERRHGLQRDDVAVILCLAITTATTAQQIARYTGRPKNSISRAVNGLSERRLLRRRSHPDDGRAVVLQLTAAGRRIFTDISADFATRDAELLNALAPDEGRLFVNVLLKVAAASNSWGQR